MLESHLLNCINGYSWVRGLSVQLFGFEWVNILCLRPNCQIIDGYFKMLQYLFRIWIVVYRNSIKFTVLLALPILQHPM